MRKTSMVKKTLSRWQQFYKDSPELQAIPPSSCADQAAKIFTENNSHIILDLGCGTGRDTLRLADSGVRVVGLDAARSGLSMAKKRATSLQSSTEWVESDARILPFMDTFFDGVYCFGLLHEFVGESATIDVREIMREIFRVLKPLGVAILAVSAGDPEKGLPQVQNFSEAMFDAVTAEFDCIDKKVYDDLGCTGRTDYKVWFGHFVKQYPVYISKEFGYGGLRSFAKS